MSRYQDRKRECIQQLGGKCVRCGTTENLEFDHIDPRTKSFAITPKLLISKARLDLELAKCQLLCHTCHKIKTAEDITVTGHGMRLCKCSDCMKAKRDYMRVYMRTWQKVP